MKGKEITDKKLCACGCGNLIPVLDNWGRIRTFKNGHSLHNSGRFQKGVKHTDEWKEKMSEKMKGKIFTEERCKNISRGLIGRRLSPQSRLNMSLAKRKGNVLGYQALHKLLRKILMPPDSCEFCHKPKKLQLANMTGIYNLDINNWRYLCAKCHVYYDGTVYNLKCKHSDPEENSINPRVL